MAFLSLKTKVKVNVTATGVDMQVAKLCCPPSRAVTGTSRLPSSAPCGWTSPGWFGRHRMCTPTGFFPCEPKHIHELRQEGMNSPGNATWDDGFSFTLSLYDLGLVYWNFLLASKNAASCSKADSPTIDRLLTQNGTFKSRSIITEKYRVTTTTKKTTAFWYN